MTSITKKLTELGQSLWLDNIQRKALENGELKRLIEQDDIRGVTSNPTIFDHAIAKSGDYESALTSLAWAGWDEEKIFTELAIEDIRAACDLLQPVYEQTNGGDGYVSIEESPLIAHDTEASVVQAQQLWARVARPNLFVKIPATKEGIPAIQHSIAAGVNINITLIFSLQRYAEVMEAYLSGLEQRLQAGHTIDHIASVASFFVSRVDTKVDGWLPENSPLKGKAAIANAKLAYEKFLRTFQGERWEKLKITGARLQRPLWASTSTKNPAYPDTLYVDNLVGANTVNTIPPQTLDAIRDHGKAVETITVGLDEAKETMRQLEAAGISMDKATQELEDEGVDAFSKSLESLFHTINERRSKALSDLGPLKDKVPNRINQLELGSFPSRIWNHEAALWTQDAGGQQELRKRLGWLDLPESSWIAVDDIRAFVDQLKATGIKYYLLIGMGGSSLAAEVFSRIFNDAKSPLAILDSTDPDEVAETGKRFPPSETLYIVASKSGGTIEVNANYDYFWDLAKGDGSRFIAITDQGTALDQLARERRFLKIFHANPNVGGRYSALTHFGLVPAALSGIDISKLLDQAEWMRKQCSSKIPAARNPGLTLGAVLGEAALAGRNKLTILADRPFEPFGSWLEQLIAESTGKNGKGILPIDLEPLGQPQHYGEDRLFVYFRMTGEFDGEVAELQAANHPVIEIPVTDPYSFSSEIYRWEFAIATAGHILGINAFDQPDVQDNKGRTKKLVSYYIEKGKFEKPAPILESDNIQLFTNMDLTGNNLEEIMTAFLDAVRPGDYVAINAFLPREGQTTEELNDLRRSIRNRTKCATTAGYGPRYLHSTGQFQKGGTNQGLFLIITAEPQKDLEIPTQALTFSKLERAQALGDYEVLASRQRRVLRMHFTSKIDLRLITRAMSG